MGFDIYARDNDKVYFRASVWSWRPILALIDKVNAEEFLGIDTNGWAYNDGHGITDNPELCKKLADALRKRIKHPEMVFTVEGSTPMRVDDEGRLLRDNDPKWAEGKTPWETDGEKVLQFCKFLYNCGGSFEIN